MPAADSRCYYYIEMTSNISCMWEDGSTAPSEIFQVWFDLDVPHMVLYIEHVSSPDAQSILELNPVPNRHLPF